MNSHTDTPHLTIVEEGFLVSLQKGEEYFDVRLAEIMRSAENIGEFGAEHVFRKDSVDHVGVAHPFQHTLCAIL
jgi:hypothetical protein